jgi:histidyl-tRNA synthetase
VTAIQAPKGTYDLLPDEAERRDRIVATAAQVFGSFGYRHIVTPEFEDTSLFQRGVGEATDIVRKEMYTFADKGRRMLTLRPEGTAPVCRAYIEHGLHKLPQPVKLWYYAPMFRYEKPQSGRYREHYQLGAEAVGSAEAAVDAEIILLLNQLLKELRVSGLRLAVNSIGDPACRPAYVASLRQYLQARSADLCAECRERSSLNPLRTFDCKEPGCRDVLAAAPRFIDHLCPECRAHFDRVLALLATGGLHPELDYRLVRGLDYYTRTTFEFSADNLGAQSGVGGGGRYDGLMEQIGGPPTPGVGFGTGLERITLAMGSSNETVTAPILAYVVCFDEAAREQAFALAQLLRVERVSTELDLADRSSKGQLKQAARLGARAAVMVGLPELPAHTARLRDLRNGAERDVPAEALAAEVRALGSGEGAPA